MLLNMNDEKDYTVFESTDNMKSINTTFDKLPFIIDNIKKFSYLK